MSEIKQLRKRQRLRWGVALLSFVILNLVLRAMLLPINEGEYTDGILAITQFREHTGIYPPLYGALVWPFSWIFGELYAARFVSWGFSAAGVIPLFLLARRSFGVRAAVFAALVYTVAPVSLRWSTRVMTDATFCFFFWFAVERLMAAQGATGSRPLERALTFASIFTVLAALTRYQGILLVPAIVGVLIYQYRRRGMLGWKGLLPLAGLVLLPVWSMLTGNIHASQFSERWGEFGPLYVLVLTAEPFLLTMPYFLTYPVAFLTLLGMTVGKARSRYMLMPMTLYFLVSFLVLQSLFASFQERYFLPFFGLLYIWAGLGLAVVDDRGRRYWPRFRFHAPVAVTVWSLFVAFLVVAGSRGAFGDLVRATRYAVDVVDAAGRGDVYTTEIYRHGRADPAAGGRIAATKASFYADREVRYLSPEVLAGREPLARGDVLLLSSRDLVGDEFQRLRDRYQLELLGQFQTGIVPIFPDLMEQRQQEQTPLAWLLRYQPQSFETRVYRVIGPRAAP